MNRQRVEWLVFAVALLAAGLTGLSLLLWP